MDGQTSPSRGRRPHGTFKEKLGSFGPGDHLCFLYESDNERREILTTYIRQGLERNDKVLCIMDAGNAEKIYGTLRDDGLDPDPYIASGRLAVLSSDQTYLRDGIFDPDAMIDLLEYETQKTVAQGFNALRVTGEMAWALRRKSGSDRLIEYEAKLNRFFPGSRCMALCQYDAGQFDAKSLLRVLMTHPVAVIGTTVYDNGYYVAPDDFFGSDPERTTLKQWIRSLETSRRYEQELEKMVEKRTRELQKTEDLLMVREKTARSMLNAITESVLLLDPQGTIADINETAAQRLHGTPAGMIGTSAYDYIPADTAEVRKGYVNEILRTGKAVRFQDVRNNHIIYNNLCPVFDENGKVVQIAVFGRDVTLEKQAEEALKESKNQLRHLSAQLIDSQEKERRRIAVELHDELGQSLMVLKLQLRSAYNNCGRDPDAAKASVHDGLRYIDEIADRIRWLCRDLSPAGLEDLGLAAVVGKLAEESTRHTATAIFKEIDEIREEIPYERQIVVFRIFQEALTNALKHARARKIRLKIKKNANALHCVIEDNGRGGVSAGDQHAGSSNGGLGLIIMRERARMLGGRLDIRSRPSAGTRIAFTVPLEKGGD
jgi:PAS domain S-box-containing protein